MTIHGLTDILKKNALTMLICGAAPILSGSEGIKEVHSQLLPPEYPLCLKKHQAAADDGSPLPFRRYQKTGRTLPSASDAGQARLKKMPAGMPEPAGSSDGILSGSPGRHFADGNKTKFKKEKFDMNQQLRKRIVRLSIVTVDPAQLETYRQFAAECGKRSMAEEPGVIFMYSMADRKQPNRISILEIYADQAAYEKHIRSAHFRKYKQGTLSMVRKLELLDQTALIPEMKMK